MTLRLGSKGDRVRDIQSKLGELEIYSGPIDGIFGDATRKAVVRYQESKRLNTDGVVGPSVIKALGMKMELAFPELERTEFRALIARNPNYFGTQPLSGLQAVTEMSGERKYEELMCLGYNPELNRLEAVVHIKLEYGYTTDICSHGSPEYVRFFVDWKDDGNWVDAGMVNFTAYNIPGDKPLEYAVAIQLTVKEQMCIVEYLPKVRAILSWNRAPTAGDPNFEPVWGNVLDAYIQIKESEYQYLETIFETAGFEIPAEMTKLIDLKQEIQLIKSKEMGFGEIHELYKDKKVDPFRYCSPYLHQVLSMPIAVSDKVKAMLEATGVEFASLVSTLSTTSGDLSYEELTCIGYNQNQRKLVGVIKVKKQYGYSGNLCKPGSYEYVAFWEWSELFAMWRYLGTATVNVHDIESIPDEGLFYSVMLPVDFSHHQRPCAEGPSVVKIRAVLSWRTPPSTTDPDRLPTWGNRQETHVQIKPGPTIGLSTQIPYIDSVGNIDVCDIDQSSGHATGDGVTIDFTPSGDDDIPDVL
ncbi:MAG: peptidoglycan-binding domain-containing protein, partial [Candidatus Thorarchaeota archaeon]